MLYEFELVHNAAEATKNICYTKDEDVVDHSNHIIQEFVHYRNTDNQASSWRPEIEDSLAVFQTIYKNRASNTRRLPGELGITWSSVKCYLNKLGRSIRKYRFISHPTKI